MKGKPLPYQVECQHHDEDGDVTTIHRTQDVEPILNHNARLRAEGDGWSPNRTMRHIGTIPAIVIEKWSQMYGVNITALPQQEKLAFIEKMLMSSDWAKLRTVDNI